MLMQNNHFSKKISLLSLFTAFAVILSYVESFLPSVWIPGVKLGLANFAVVLALYLFGAKEALLINIVRIVIISAMFGNLFGIWFSFAGAFLSFIAMFLLKRTNRVSIVTVGMIGGVFHNIGQTIVAAFAVDSYAVYVYLPVLMIAGLITGAIIGILAAIVFRRTERVLNRSMFDDESE